MSHSCSAVHLCCKSWCRRRHGCNWTALGQILPPRLSLRSSTAGTLLLHGRRSYNISNTPVAGAAQSRNRCLHRVSETEGHIPRPSASRFKRLPCEDRRYSTRDGVNTSVAEKQRPEDVGGSVLRHTDNPKQPLRTKYLRLATWANTGKGRRNGPLLESSMSPQLKYDETWSRMYHDAIHGGKMVNLNEQPLKFYNKNDLLSRRYTGPRLTRSNIRTAWLQIRPSLRLPLWRSLTLWCLQHSPRRALQLVVAALEGTYIPVPRYVAAECLQNVVLQYLQRGKKLDPWAFQTILRAVHSFVERGRSSQLTPFVPEQVCYFLFKQANEQQFVSLLQKLQQGNVQMHANTLLQAMDRCVEIGDVTLALRLLRSISRSGMDLHKPQIHNACAKLVRLRFDSGSQFATRMNIVHDILEMGIQPNLLVHKAILYNAFEDEQIDFAISYFYALEASGVHCDSFMYNILIQGAMRHLGQAEVRKFVRKAENDERNLADPALASTMLRAIARNRGASYGAVLRFYRRHWDLEPLRELGIADEAEQAVPSEIDPIKSKPPTPSILRQMFCIYLRAHRWQKSTTEIYTRYQDHVRDQHPLISQLGMTDSVANAFLLCFGRTTQTLGRCATVMRDMLDASRSQRLSVQMEQTATSASPPTVQSWSILAAAYFRHGQKQAAEKVLSLMRERGIGREQVTWNTIIDGYASLQDVGKAVDAIVGMQKSGMDITKRTMRSLRKIKDREHLSNAFANMTGLSGLVTQEVAPAGREIEDPQAIMQRQLPQDVPESETSADIARLQEEYSKMRMDRETNGIDT